MLTVRVYGILRQDSGAILVSDEYIRGNFFTKFPGGGLEAGEGTRDCLKREFMEEMNLKVEIGDHLYTTDFYQKSAFNPSHQILSIYYFAHALEPIAVPLKTKPFDFEPEKIADPQGTAEAFRLIQWEEFDEASVSLPIDKIVARMLKERF